MLNQISLRVKLALAFLLVAIIVALAGAYEVRSIENLSTAFTQLINNDMGRRDRLTEARSAGNQIETSSLLFSQSVQDRTSTKTAASQAADLATLHQTAMTALSKYESLLQQSGNTTRIPKTLPTTLASDTDALYAASKSFVAAAASLVPAKLGPSRQTLEQAAATFDQHIDQLAGLENDQTATATTEVTGDVSALVNTILLLVVAVALFAGGLGLLIAALVGRSLRRLKAGAERLANGDFSQVVPIASRDELGQLAAAFNAMADRLRESYQRLSIETEQDKTLLESLGEGVIAIDATTNITLINSKAQEILELDQDKAKLVGVPVNHGFTIYDEHDKALTGQQTPAVAALKSLKNVSDVFGFHRHDGSKILVAVSANPVVVDKQVRGAIMTLRDVTKEREVDRMKTEFISLASHQLRTPLSAIKWFTEMLVSGDAGKLKPDQLDFAKNIADSTERMIALVNALLNISRIESGRIMIDPKPTDLRELVSGIINDLKAKTEERQQTLIISVHSDLPKINVDPRLVGQVYLNLLTNAIKYTPKGGEISVFISKKDDQVISQIADNGYGIPKDQQGRVFQKFFRAANAVKVETDGTGLGLYLIKAVVESSGGKIWFKSEENKGSTFWFSIPLSGMKPKEGEVTLDA